MAGIKRFITYIYAYENGTKGINTGFAKVEIRGNECRIEVHLRGTPIRMGMDQVYLIHSHPNWCSTQMHFNPAFISPDLHFCKSRVDSFCSVFVCIYICNKTFDSCHRMLPAFILLLLYIFIGRL